MKNISRILQYVKDYKGKVILYFVFSLLAVLFSLFSLGMLSPIMAVIFGVMGETAQKADGFLGSILGTINQVVTEQGKTNALAYICIAAVGFTLLKNLFLYLSMFVLTPLRNAILRRLREEMFDKILSLPIGFFTEERKGDLVSKMTNDMSEVEYSIVSVLEVFIREPLTIIFFLVAMVSISPQLTVFLLVFLPVAGLIIGRISKSLKRISTQAQEQTGAMLGLIDETIAGMRVVKAFNAEKHQRLRFFQLNNILFRTKNSLTTRRDLASPVSETLGVLVVSIILWYGGRLVLSNEGELAGALFLQYIVYFTQIINPFKNLSTAFYNVKKGSAALQRIEDLLHTENVVKEMPNAKPIKSFEHTIELKNVHFNYGDKKILNGIDLEIEKGKTVALVGASGAGKSTLVDLIPRFHDVSSGEILIDGVNVKEYKLDDMRRLMGVVSQDPILFNDTIYNNITLGTGGATQERVEEAAKIAHAHNFIMKKELGYLTEVGDRGSRLSGGERQRVTIARAVLKNPPILILDEATSSLDTESERMVQDAINQLMQHRTCIVIAHRLSTVQHADEIIVLNNGTIAERGTHATLIQNNGLYKKLVEMQQVR
ncbi:MAG: ABC transporter ATP-binding protein [Flavipsychrobacter sp.]|nr:ABC transporter ATP-binding protein [Flavipsychrobacter sp.]